MCIRFLLSDFPELITPLHAHCTLIVRCADGGPLDGAHDNAPLRGGKLNFFEGGLRPAAFVASPLLPPGVSGTRYAGIVHETDWFATFIGLAGVPSPPTGLDGVDFWPTLNNLSRPHRSNALLADNILRVGK